MKPLCLLLAMLLGMNGCIQTRPVATSPGPDPESGLQISAEQAEAINNAADHGHGGTLKRVDGTSIRFASLHVDNGSISIRGGEGEINLPLSQVVEIRIRTPHAGRGGARGFGAGAAVGALVGAAVGEACPNESEVCQSQGGLVIGLGLLFGAAGGLIGLVSGGSDTQRFVLQPAH